jgi:hypothetical protein
VVSALAGNCPLTGPPDRYQDWLSGTLISLLIRSGYRPGIMEA